MKVNLDKKNLSETCKNSSRTTAKDNVADVFILISDKSLEIIKIKYTDNDKQSS